MPKAVIRNIDYIFVPIAFWVIKTLFFQPKGVYAQSNYNSVSLGGVAGALLGLPKTFIYSIYNICLSYVEILSKNIFFSIAVILAAIAIGILVHCRMGHADIDENLKRDFTLFIIGVLVLLTAIFPYAVVGRMDGVYNTGVQGRDSLLLGFGISICIYFGVQMLLRSWGKYTCYIFIIILGIVHFNIWYLNYQMEWYKSLEFEDVVASEPDIKENNTFWVIQEYDAPCGTSRFYCLNVNAYEVLGDQTRFFADMMWLVDDYSDMISEGYGMDDYDSSDRTIDGVIVLKDNEMSYSDTLHLKWLEITDKDEFEKTIRGLDRYEYYSITPEQAQELVDGYISGTANGLNLLDIALGIK